MSSVSRAGTKPNDRGLTLTDVKTYYIERIVELGYAKTKKQAEDLFIESIARNFIISEVLECCEHIAQESN